MSDTLNLEAVSRNPRLSDMVSERLLAAIRGAGLEPGARLPSERELGDQFGVSRTVIREAIRHLAAKGILEVRSGSGAVVSGVSGSSVSDALSLYLGRKGLPDPQKIHEVREIIEVQTARLAAQRASDADLAEIRRVHEQLAHVADDPEAASAADVEFHRAIANATDNELFVVLVDSIGDVMMDIRRATILQPGRVQVGVEYHERILEALERRDAEAAAQAMEDHLVESLQALTKVGRRAKRAVRPARKKS
jgi:GntR family transcriptional regulator, transcriptional repressor for pyruvate dehydrogenase complex